MILGLLVDSEILLCILYSTLSCYADELCITFGTVQSQIKLTSVANSLLPVLSVSCHVLMECPYVIIVLYS